MELEPKTSVRTDTDGLGKVIAACEEASIGILQVLHFLRVHGQTAQQWAGDSVSLDVAGHYTNQLWAGAQCTYSAVHNYYLELGSTIETMQQTLNGYKNFDGAVADSMEQL
jgi:hypothetical protein